VYYSLGFHAKPVMVFAPALSLGVASLAEYVDVKLCADGKIDFASLPARLSEASLDGLDFFAAEELLPGDAKLSQLVHEGEYVAGFPRATLAELGLPDEAALRAAVQAKVGTPLRARREIQGNLAKWVDVSRYLISAEVGEGGAELERAGIVGELIPVRVRLAITGEGSAKISEALETLLGKTEVPARIVRTGLYAHLGDQRVGPLELETVRALRSAMNTTAEASDADAADQDGAQE
jgi:hypothetical protein